MVEREGTVMEREEARREGEEEDERRRGGRKSRFLALYIQNFRACGATACESTIVLPKVSPSQKRARAVVATSCESRIVLPLCKSIAKARECGR